MPFTPLHMSPGMLFKAALPRHFSITAFGLAQIFIDIEVLWFLSRGEYHHLHRFWHTYPGATIAAAGAAVLGKPVSQWLKRIWNSVAGGLPGADLTLEAVTGWKVSLIGAAAGAYSHIVLDSIYHGDMKPFWPWSESNPLYGIISPRNVDVMCAAMGMAGLLLFIERERRRKIRKQQRVNSLKLLL